MKKVTFFVLAAISAFILAGCTSAARNLENAKLLKIGMTKSQVLSVMGEPLTEEEFCTPDIWFYYVRTVWADGLNTQDECLPLVFEKGKLTGWGNEFYARYRSRGVRNTREIELTGAGNLKK